MDEFRAGFWASELPTELLQPAEKIVRWLASPQSGGLVLESWSADGQGWSTGKEFVLPARC